VASNNIVKWFSDLLLALMPGNISNSNDIDPYPYIYYLSILFRLQDENI
jgi:hypothetical protein